LFLAAAGVTAAAALAAVGAAQAAAPILGSVSQRYGVPSVIWTNPADAKEIRIQIRRRRAVVSGATFAADQNVSSWKADGRLNGGTYTVRVGALTCDDGSRCRTEWSEEKELVIPKPQIEPGKGIAFVSLGMTKQEVEAIWGRPDESHGGTDTLRGGVYWTYVYKRHGLTVGFRGRPYRVSAVSTRKKIYTVAGTEITNGVSEAKLRATLRGVRCRTFGKRKVPRALRWRSCWLGRLARGQVVTLFAISPASKRVGAISVFRVSKLLPNGSPL
jgi:hypothetical protein